MLNSKSRAFLVYFLILSALLTGCYPAGSRSLSSNEITDVVSRHKITPLITKNTANSTTILFRRGNEIGCLYASGSNFGSEEEVALKTSSAPFFKRNIAEDPVVIIQIRDMNEEHYCMLINDVNLQTQTKYAEIVFMDGSSSIFEKVNPLGGIFVRNTDKPAPNYSKFTIYDKDMNEIMTITPELFSK